MPASTGDLAFSLVDEASFDAVPAPARAGSRCQTCDYWERLDGTRDAPAADAKLAGTTRANAKRARLLAGAQLAGTYGLLAWQTDGDAHRVAVGWAQFGPLSAYPRAQVIRDRYPQLPDSPAPWVVTCLQVLPSVADRDVAARALIEAVCDELDRRGITAVEAYPEGVSDPWELSSGPRTAYEAAGFSLAAGDDRYPVLRRELTSSLDSVGWGDLLARTRTDDEGEGWPLPLPKGPREEDVFRLPPKPAKPNPFGEG